MPTYDYICKKCLAQFDINASVSRYERGLDVKCPACGSNQVRRTMSNVSILGSCRRNSSLSTGGCCGSGTDPGCCG
jgi:putative FmdB family regulatory protein